MNLYVLYGSKKKNIQMNNQKAKLGNIEGWLSMAVNILLFGLKYWAGIVSGSVALIADAWHTLSDSLSSIVVLVGMKISRKPADEEHPFGHGRAELIASIIIAVFLAVIAFNFITESIHKLQSHEVANYGEIAIIVTIISVLMKEGIAQFALWAGKKVDAPSLKADGWHHRTDAISSVIILIGIFLGKYFWWIDGVLGLIVSGMILYAAYEILKESANSLLGEKPSKKLIEQLHTIAKNAAGYDVKVHHIHIHRYGEHKEITFHIALHDDIQLKKAHQIIEKIEEKVDQELDMCATIHPDPIDGVMD